jgi:hypothetical protein
MFQVMSNKPLMPPTLLHQCRPSRLSSSRAHVEIQEEMEEDAMAPATSPRSGTQTPASEAASALSGESSGKDSLQAA